MHLATLTTTGFRYNVAAFEMKQICQGLCAHAYVDVQIVKKQEIKCNLKKSFV